MPAPVLPICMKLQTVIACCLLTGAISFAQDAPDRPRREGPPPGGAPGPGPGPRFAIPLMQALDANHDGVIDEKEIANASAALKSLDKNNDGKLTPEELRPPMGNRRPDGPRGEGEGRPRPRPPGEQ
jgi:EF hand domain-containing protein